jgi:hypothetical protein
LNPVQIWFGKIFKNLDLNPISLILIRKTIHISICSPNRFQPDLPSNPKTLLARRSIWPSPPQSPFSFSFAFLPLRPTRPFGPTWPHPLLLFPAKGQSAVSQLSATAVFRRLTPPHGRPPTAAPPLPTGCCLHYFLASSPPLPETGEVKQPTSTSHFPCRIASSPQLRPI